MISFYPGPSYLHAEIPAYMQLACSEGILSVNHRSPEFVALCMKTIALLKEKLLIPKDYTIFFTSSATECWEIIAQSCIQKKSFHFYNGAFGEKWLETTQKFHSSSVGFHFELNTPIPINTVAIPTDCELIAVTQSETSNGTEISNKSLSALRNQYPESIIAVDATSSMGGRYLDFQHADIWFASVQKCFGLPAGMALLICSPKALERAIAIGDQKHYNSLLPMIERMKSFQTTYTPNVLSIYLLMKVLENSPSILEINSALETKAKLWYDFLSNQNTFELLIKSEEVRSKTVIALSGEESLITKIKQAAKMEGLVLGNGYGDWKTTTFRIANFPAHKTTENEILKEFLIRFS